MKRKIAALLSAAAIGLVAAVATVHPATAYYDACASHSITIYEGANGAGDRITFCASVWNLQNVAHTQPGFCDTGWALRVGDRWNDCMSSFRVNAVQYGCRITLWDGAGFENPRIGPVLYRGSEGLWNVYGSWNDALSSIMMGCG